MASTPTNPRVAGKTPSRTPRSAVHTPLDRSVSRDLLNSVRRGTSASGGPRGAHNNAPTPHAKAARRALNDRRTAIFTPGKNRRKSQMEQRETPMDILRRLGSTLAPKSKPISSSSSSASSDTPPERPPRMRSSGFTSIHEKDTYELDDDDEPLPKRPRFSLPIDQSDDDDDEEPLRQPRISDITMRSVEFARRFDPDQQSEFHRESMGSMRASDVFRNDEFTEDLGRPSNIFPEGQEVTAEGFQPNDDPTIGGDSSFGFDIPALDEPSGTFVLSAPPMDPEPTSPIVDQPTAEDIPMDAPGSADDFSDREPAEDIWDQGPPSDDVSVRSDEGGIPPGDVSSDGGGDIEVTATQQHHQEMPSTKREPMPPRMKNRISRHGIEYPSLPPAFVKRVAQTALQSSGLSNPRIPADTLTALTQASDWFFEQLGDDLGAYAHHAKRKTVEESDVVTLMRRQRQIGSTSTMFSLAQKHLPRELLQELRMPLPQPTKKRREKRRRDDDGEEGQEIT
ncbi:hypothetical protein ACO1O0_005594 [Amphichorda felina]